MNEEHVCRSCVVEAMFSRLGVCSQVRDTSSDINWDCYKCANGTFPAAYRSHLCFAFCSQQWTRKVTISTWVSFKNFQSRHYPFLVGSSLFQFVVVWFNLFWNWPAGFLLLWRATSHMRGFSAGEPHNKEVNLLEKQDLMLSSSGQKCMKTHWCWVQ